MKIIRLVSDVVTTSIFNKSINVPIIIKPNSKVALKSLSFETEHITDFQVTDTSYQLRYTVDDKTGSALNWYTVTVPTGTYNIKTFLEYLKFAMNVTLSAIDPTKNYYGFEWNTSLVNDRVNFSFGKSDFAAILSSNMTISPNMTVNNNAYSRQNNTPDTDAYAQSNTFISKGSYKADCTITTGDANLPQCTFYVGLCASKFAPANKPTLAASDFSVAAFSDGTSNVYKIKSINGDIIDSVVQYEKNDVIRILKTYENGIGYMNLYCVKNNAPSLLYKFSPLIDFVNTNQYLTVALGSGSQGVTFTTLTQIQSAFVSSSVDGKYIVSDVLEDVLYNSNLQAVFSSRVQLDFLTDIMQSFLGFANKLSVITGISGNFTANSIAAVDLIAIGDDISVELQTLNLDGYDSLKQSKSPILAIIPIESLSKNGFGYSYIEPFPTFLSMNFQQTTSVNTFSINMTAGNKPIKLTDKVYMQLLISD